eukprot:1497564-Prymnesium_polylepis.1
MLGMQVASCHASRVVLDDVALGVDLRTAGPHGLDRLEMCDARIVSGHVDLSAEPVHLGDLELLRCVPAWSAHLSFREDVRRGLRLRGCDDRRVAVEGRSREDDAVVLLVEHLV